MEMVSWFFVFQRRFIFYEASTSLVSEMVD